ncbi:MAG: BrnA antitoxin family protein [Armatimonadetes bacterium]|nr:BrnA antitoxin family protein [Armatimonadota bacterium]
MSKKNPVDQIPDEFKSYEEAAEFWDHHDTTDYPDVFRTVEVSADFQKRIYEVEIDEEVVEKLRIHARQKGITVSRLASELLRQQLNIAR